MKVTLLSTAPKGACNSMHRYLEIVNLANETIGHSHYDFNTKYLSLDQKHLNKLPCCLRNYFHHLSVVLKTLLIRFFTKADVYFILDGSHAYIINFLGHKKKTLVSAHDIIPLLNQKNILQGKAPSLFGNHLLSRSIKGLNRADFIAAISQSTKNDLMQLLKIPEKKIVVLYNPLPCFSPGESPQTQTEKYIFHLGHNGHYKNREGVLRVFAELVKVEPTLLLKMAGPAPSEELIHLSRELEIESQLKWFVLPNDQELTTLYQNACLFLFPSRYEGFGWPPLEAQFHQTPVVCSNAASLPEVVGNSALNADPDDINVLTRLCLKVIQDEELAGSLVQKGNDNIKRFSKENFQNQLQEIYAYFN